jgi:restriction system protein
VFLATILWEEAKAQWKEAKRLWEAGKILIVCGIIGGLALLLAKKLQEARQEAKREAKRKSTVERELRALLEKHLSTLALKKRQLTTTDAYGIEDNSKWMKERARFIDKVVHPQLNERPTPNEIDSFVQLIEGRTIDLITTVDQSGDYDDAMEAIQFEHFCAQIARRVGWDARVTQGSGDQGIDVIANNTTHKVVLQCKKHTRPIGIKAVQEIVAGKHFENADFAAVVSNAPFTPAAMQLASSAGVALLHHFELEHYLLSLTPASRADHT